MPSGREHSALPPHVAALAARRAGSRAPSASAPTAPRGGAPPRIAQRGPDVASAERPLAGLTILAVEDSRYACETLRLLCLHSGARMRRAETLADAARHLATYHPSVALVDLGLPDGSGLDLIREMVSGTAPPPAILAMSGRDELAAAALAAGAAGFLSKPIASIADFQAAVLSALSCRRTRRGEPPHPVRPSKGGEPAGQPRPPAAPAAAEIAPDDMALRDDLARALRLLAGNGTTATTVELHYLAGFLRGIAEIGDDAGLRQMAEAAARLSQEPEAAARSRGILRLSDGIEARLSVTATL